MIIVIKNSEIKDMIHDLEELEENFWLKYKYYNESNRQFLEDKFNGLYAKFYELLAEDGVQEEMEI